MPILEIQPETRNPFLTPAAVAKLLGCSRRAVLDAVRRGRLPATRISERSIRIPASAIEPTTAAPSTESSEGGAEQ
jgi:excisionase family DNA binding protein